MSTSALSIGIARTGLEIKQFFREKTSVLFIFALPIVFLILFGAIFGNADIGGGYHYTQALLPAMLTMGVVSTSLVNLGIWIANDRDNGTMRRLVLTPMPKVSYFLGKIGMIVVVSVIESIILIAAGVLIYGVKLPQTGTQWLTLAWVSLLSFAVLGTLGIAISSLAPNARSAPGIVQFPSLILQFISGIFIPFNELPKFLQDISAFFPLKWIAQGFRSAFLPDSMAAHTEPSGSWQHGLTAIVLLAWLIGGLVLCLLTFRWKRRGEG